MGDTYSEVKLKDVTHQDLLNPSYNMELTNNGSSTTAVETTVPHSTEVSTMEPPDYDTIGPNNTEERRFNNPIYGDELTSNVYSHTSHPIAHPPSKQATPPDIYSHTSHSIGPPSQQAGGGTVGSLLVNEYSALAVVEYKMPTGPGQGKHVNEGTNELQQYSIPENH